VLAGSTAVRSVSARSTDLVANSSIAVVDGYDLNAFRMRYLSVDGYASSAQETNFDQLCELSSTICTDGFDFNILRTDFIANVRGAYCP
jgi:hypothetical protein